MDWNLAIEKNREALKRILAMLVAMAGIGGGLSAIPGRQSGSEPAQAPMVGLIPSANCRLPTAAYSCPAISIARSCACSGRPKSAARRLIIVTARGLVVTLPPPRPRKAKPAPNHPAQARRHRHSYAGGAAFQRPPPLWGGEGRRATARPPPCRCSIRSGPFAPGRGPSRTAFPASRFPASPRRFPSRSAARPRPTIRSTRPASRSASRRWARRWTTCRDRQSASPAGGLRATPQARKIKKLATPQARKAKIATGRTRRVWPLRPGRPPGQRPANRRTHEVHEILHDLHGLAFDVLEHPDTS